MVRSKALSLFCGGMCLIVAQFAWADPPKPTMAEADVELAAEIASAPSGATVSVAGISGELLLTKVEVRYDASQSTVAIYGGGLAMPDPNPDPDPDDIGYVYVVDASALGVQVAVVVEGSGFTSYGLVFYNDGTLVSISGSTATALAAAIDSLAK